MNLPSNVIIDVEEKTVLIKFTKTDDTTYVEIDAFWLNGKGTYDQKTTGNAFYFEKLQLGTEYKFTLRAFSKAGEMKESGVYTFKTREIVKPIPPSNIKMIFDEGARNNVTIKFTKGQGVKTEIDAFWIDGENTWDDYTLKDGFYYKNLPWGSDYSFRLRSVAEDGKTFAQTQVYTFSIPKIEEASAPYDIKATCNPLKVNDFTIEYKKGNGILTQVKKLYDSKSDWETVQSPFVIKDLPWKTTSLIKLRTVSDFNTTAETDNIELDVPEMIAPTEPKKVQVIIDEDKKDHVTIKFTKGSGVRTEIDFFNQNTWKEYTTDNGFDYENLTVGKDYVFRLRSAGNNGTYAVSKEYSFKITEIEKATAPTNVTIDVKEETATVTFTKGKGKETDIDCFWINGEGTWDDSTDNNKFVLDGLKPNFQYKFRLQSVGEGKDNFALSRVYSFTVPEVEKIRRPSDIKVTCGKSTAYIKFTKGTSYRTYIDKHWVNGEGTWDDYTSDNGFVINNLSPGEYSFTLGSFNKSGDHEDSESVSFKIIGDLILGENGEEVTGTPTLPTDVTTTVEGKCVTIKYHRGHSARVYIDAFWIHGEGTWDDSSAKEGSGKGEGFYFENLIPGTEYRFKLKAVVSNGDSIESEVYKFNTLSDGGGTGEIIKVNPIIPNEIVNAYEEKWFYRPSTNGNPVGVTGDITGYLDQYGAVYEGNINEKKVYLTFDEGYEIGNTPKLIKTLKDNGVSGSFCITNQYLQNNKEYVKLMVEKGMNVCNHSTTHPAMANVARHGGKEGVAKELLTLADNFKALTGKEICKFFRPPMGKYSELVLKYVQELGYKPLFWSFSYVDFNIEEQKDPEWVLEFAESCLHNGCIYLLHAVSNTNTEILDRLIKHIKEEGYEIGDLKELL